MRSDMNKVLTERPRACGTGRNDYSSRLKLRYGKEDPSLPKRESMRRRYRGNRKEFTDLLNPLVRYLHSQVGRPWDKVWSDICKVLRGNGLQATHVKGHIKDMVGGIPHSGRCYFKDSDWFSPSYGGRKRELYVDKHKILRHTK